MDDIKQIDYIREIQENRFLTILANDHRVVIRSIIDLDLMPCYIVLNLVKEIELLERQLENTGTKMILPSELSQCTEFSRRIIIIPYSHERLYDIRFLLTDSQQSCRYVFVAVRSIPIFNETRIIDLRTRLDKEILYCDESMSLSTDEFPKDIIVCEGEERQIIRNTLDIYLTRVKSLIVFVSDLDVTSEIDSVDSFDLYRIDNNTTFEEIDQTEPFVIFVANDSYRLLYCTDLFADVVIDSMRRKTYLSEDPIFTTIDVSIEKSIFARKSIVRLIRREHYMTLNPLSTDILGLNYKSQAQNWLRTLKKCNRDISIVIASIISLPMIDVWISDDESRVEQAFINRQYDQFIGKSDIHTYVNLYNWILELYMSDEVNIIEEIRKRYLNVNIIFNLFDLIADLRRDYHICTELREISEKEITKIYQCIRKYNNEYICLVQREGARVILVSSDGDISTLPIPSYNNILSSNIDEVLLLKVDIDNIAQITLTK